MKGKVLDFNLQLGEGIISGNDGERYSFVSEEWKSTDTRPAKDVEVDFVIEDGKATGIYAEAKVIVQSNNVDAMGVWQYYVDAVKNKYATFEGRATRSAFWYYQLVNFIILVILSTISAGILGLIYSLAVLVPGWAVGARRLHDTGKSGWWQLIALIPLIGIIVLIIFWVQESTIGKNKYGKPQ